MLLHVKPHSVAIFPARCFLNAAAIYFFLEAPTWGMPSWWPKEKASFRSWLLLKTSSLYTFVHATQNTIHRVPHRPTFTWQHAAYSSGLGSGVIFPGDTVSNIPSPTSQGHPSAPFTPTHAVTVQPSFIPFTARRRAHWTLRPVTSACTAMRGALCKQPQWSKMLSEYNNFGTPRELELWNTTWLSVGTTRGCLPPLRSVTVHS